MKYFGGLYKMDKFDDLMDLWSIRKAYDNHLGENRDSINRLYEYLQNQLKENFFAGYREGYENGYDNGIIDAKLKMLVKLALHTDLSDNEILEILEKEGEQHFVDALKEIRQKQSTQD